MNSTWLKHNWIKKCSKRGTKIWNHVWHCRGRLHNEISLCVLVQLWRWAGEDEPGVADGPKDWYRWVSLLAQILRHLHQRSFVQQIKVELCKADAVAGSTRTSLACRHPPRIVVDPTPTSELLLIQWVGRRFGYNWSMKIESGVELWKNPLKKKT